MCSTISGIHSVKQKNINNFYTLLHTFLADFQNSFYLTIKFIIKFLNISPSVIFMNIFIVYNVNKVKSMLKYIVKYFYNGIGVYLYCVEKMS